MHILESYALQDNLKIDKPSIYEKFFPMAVQGKYITLDVSTDDDASKYDHWHMVVDYLVPHLKELGVTIVQLGDKEDEQLPGCYIAVGQTDINPVSYTHLTLPTNREV